MSRQNIYSLTGIAWLACCLYQLKNDNMFMFAASAVLSAIFFGMSVYKKIRNNKNLSK